MKESKISERLRYIMDTRGIRQVDILEAAKPFCEKHKVKLGKTDLCQYVSGKVEPGQDKLLILSLALGVSEAWLLGYDAPKQSRLTINKKTAQSISHNIIFHRNQAGLSAKQFADIIGVDEGYVLGLESGQIKLEQDVLYKICDVLHLIPSNFIPRDEEFSEDEEYLLSRREKETPDQLVLTGVDKELYEILKLIPEDQKKIFLEMGRVFVKNLCKD